MIVTRQIAKRSLQPHAATLPVFLSSEFLSVFFEKAIFHQSEMTVYIGHWKAGKVNIQTHHHFTVSYL
jgi:hypothetical protein